MILPSSGGLDFEGGARESGSYFALQPSNLSTPSSDDAPAAGSHRFLDVDPALEHDRDDLCPGLFYYYWHKPCLTRRRMIIWGSLLAALILIIIIASSLSGGGHGDAVVKLVPPDPEVPFPPSYSKLRTFKRGAVCADGVPCAKIGKEILERNGSAVDAAIAALICNGMINMQSMGLGGGFIMTVYDKALNRSHVLNARERAPAAARPNMFSGLPEKSSLHSGLAIAVPGELAGYGEAHRRFGKLPWAELWKPNIELCENGYNLTKIQLEGLMINRTMVMADPTLVELFVDPDTKDFRPAGSLIRPKKLCETFKIIAQKDASELYNGTLGMMLVDDLKKRGSIITMEDMKSYRAKWEDPVSTELYDGTKVYTAGIPGNGGILSLILNIFDEFHFTPSDIADTNATIKTYHRMIEAFKFAYAIRMQLGDIEQPEWWKNVTTREYARAIRAKIKDDRTWNDPEHYEVHSVDKDDHGTAHISVISENGDAVSVTSTINTYFSTKIVSERTGILMNNGMDDFGVPGQLNFFGVPPNENNFIVPGKRPLSSMSPTILVDRDNNVKMNIGAAGGTKIPSALSFVIARHLWMNNTLKEAVDAPRIHHQVYPMEVSYEFGVPAPIVAGLQALGHKTERYRNRGSVVCVLTRVNGTIYANADHRKFGEVYGVN